MDSTTQDPNGNYVGQLDIYTIQYSSNKIIITDNWRTPSQRGVKTTECTLRDSLIVERVINRENRTDTTKYTFDDVGNVIKSESSVSKSVSTGTFDKNYRNPYLIKGNPIFNLLFIGGVSRNAGVASSSTQTDAMGNITTSSSKTDILEHLGSYPTRTQVTSFNVKNDYTFTYSVRNN
ncbi:hypothetical protein QEG73_13990 [Chitinophagaceae bacterium 26-R-25]|nr:hypothetical protein [Chitinophagaceae bacterium 26-R-25]